MIETPNQLYHLTMVGACAGMVLCGTDKSQAAERGERFVHAVYSDDMPAGAGTICAACQAVYDEALAD